MDLWSVEFSDLSLGWDIGSNGNMVDLRDLFSTHYFDYYIFMICCYVWINYWTTSWIPVGSLFSYGYKLLSECICSYLWHLSWLREIWFEFWHSARCFLCMFLFCLGFGMTGFDICYGCLWRIVLLVSLKQQLGLLFVFDKREICLLVGDLFADSFHCKASFFYFLFVVIGGPSAAFWTNAGIGVKSSTDSFFSKAIALFLRPSKCSWRCSVSRLRCWVWGCLLWLFCTSFECSWCFYCQGLLG